MPVRHYVRACAYTTSTAAGLFLPAAVPTSTAPTLTGCRWNRGCALPATFMPPALPVIPPHRPPRFWITYPGCRRRGLPQRYTRYCVWFTAHIYRTIVPSRSGSVAGYAPTPRNARFVYSHTTYMTTTDHCQPAPAIPGLPPAHTHRATDDATVLATAP